MLRNATEFIDCKVVLFGKPVITNDLVVSVLTSLRRIFSKFEPYHLGDMYDINFFRILYKLLEILVNDVIKTDILSLFEIVVSILISYLRTSAREIQQFPKTETNCIFSSFFFDVCLKNYICTCFLFSQLNLFIVQID